MNLEGHIICKMVFPGIRFADLPKFFALNIEGRQTTYLAVAVFRTVMHGLANKDVLLSIAIKIAKPEIASNTKTVHTDFLPENRLGIIGTEGSQFIVFCF